MFTYLDAGTGSLLLAALAGGTAGLALFFRMYGHRFLGIFSKKHRIAAQEASERLTGELEDLPEG